MRKDEHRQDMASGTNCMDATFEQKLLASQLVSEVHRSTGHVSFTFTDAGILAFAEAMRLAGMEKQSSTQNASQGLFPEDDNSLITKKDVMIGFKISHTTLWKWEKTGYLVPVKIGKRIYYRKSDIERITKRT